MVWVLLVMLASHGGEGGVYSSQYEFRSEKACQAAVAFYNFSGNHNATCVQDKGDKS